MLNNDQKQAIAQYINAPKYIYACADAIRYDLMHGPCWSLIPQGIIENFTVDHVATFYDDLVDAIIEGDVVEETYTGIVADTLRQYIDELPCELYIECDTDCVMDSEPQGYLDEELGEDIEPMPYYIVTHKSIVEAVFGSTIAKEF
jgi:hypothetical protein